MQPEPSIEPPVGGGERPRANTPSRRVGRKPVTGLEWQLAGEILAEFNSWAGTGYSVEAHITPIVGRIREHPDLAIDDHRRVIRATFLAPWWGEETPGVEVIYGNRALFERQLERAKPGGGQGGPPRPDRPGRATSSREQREAEDLEAIKRLAGRAA